MYFWRPNSSKWFSRRWCMISLQTAYSKGPYAHKFILNCDLWVSHSTEGCEYMRMEFRHAYPWAPWLTCKHCLHNEICSASFSCYYRQYLQIMGNGKRSSRSHHSCTSQISKPCLAFNTCHPHVTVPQSWPLSTGRETGRVVGLDPLLGSFFHA